MTINREPETEAAGPLIVALAHPSLEGAVAEFAAELKDEQRFFATATPKLSLTSLDVLVADGGIRLGVMAGQRLIGMSRVEPDGTAVIAIVERWRGRGVGRRLLQTTLSRAAAHGHQRVTFCCSRRSRALVDLAETVGATVVDHGRGRLDLIFAVQPSVQVV